MIKKAEQFVSLAERLSKVAYPLAHLILSVVMLIVISYHLVGL